MGAERQQGQTTCDPALQMSLRAPLPYQTSPSEHEFKNKSGKNLKPETTEHEKSYADPCDNDTLNSCRALVCLSREACQLMSEEMSCICMWLFVYL